MRYAPREGLHPILGRHVLVCDLRKDRTVTLFAGLKAWERAEARCAELNKEAANGANVG